MSERTYFLIGGRFDGFPVVIPDTIEQLQMVNMPPAPVGLTAVDLKDFTEIYIRRRAAFTNWDGRALRYDYFGAKSMSEIDVLKKLVTFKIADDKKSITCLRCARTSYNPNDVVKRFCGHCEIFHDVLRGQIDEMAA